MCKKNLNWWPQTHYKGIGDLWTKKNYSISLTFTSLKKKDLNDITMKIPIKKDKYDEDESSHIKREKPFGARVG